MNKKKYSNVLQMGDEDFTPFSDNLQETYEMPNQNPTLDPVPTSQILARRVAGQMQQLNTVPLMIRRYSNQGEHVLDEGDGRDIYGFEPRSAPLRNLRMQIGNLNPQDMSPGLKAASPLHPHQQMPRQMNYPESQSPGLQRANFFMPNSIGMNSYPSGTVPMKQSQYTHFGQGVQNISNHNSPTYVKKHSSRGPEYAGDFENLPDTQLQPKEIPVYSQRTGPYSPLFPTRGQVDTVFERDEDAEDVDGDSYLRYSHDEIAHLLYKSGDQKHLLARLESERAFFDSVYSYLLRQFPQYCKDSNLVQFCIKIISLCGDEGEKITRIVTSLDKKAVGLCKDACATRVLQRLIEKISFQPGLISRLSTQLEGHISSLVMCSNGNHVIQKLITHVEAKNVEFVYQEILKDFKAIGVHKHGCCVLQRCIDRASPPLQVCSI